MSLVDAAKAVLKMLEDEGRDTGIDGPLSILRDEIELFEIDGYRLAQDNELVPCTSCGYFGDDIGRMMTECCNGSGGCSCHGQPVDCGTCRVCNGTGMRRKNADTQANLNAIRSLAEMGRGYIGSGPYTRY